MHTSGRFFFLSAIFFACGALFFAPKNAIAAMVFLDATPPSGVDDGIAGLEVKLTCTVSPSSKAPREYIIDYGDGSPTESVMSDQYSQTFTHLYRSGIYNAVCEVKKSTGSAETTDPVTVVVAKWRFATRGDVDSSPAIGSDGTVYVGSDDGNLYAINPETGEEIWRFETGGAIPSAPAIDPEGTIYFGSLDKHVYALKPNGELKWSYQTGGEIFSSPAIWPERRILYIGSNDNHLYALNYSNGTFRWKFPTGDKIISSPSIGHDGIETVVYFGSMDTHVYALAAAGTSPKLKWKFKADAAIYASPAIGSDGRIYVGELQLESVEEYRYKFYSLNVDGTLHWSFTDFTGFYSSPAIGLEGMIYVGSRDGRFFALNPDGELDWDLRPGPPYPGIDSSPAVGSNRFVYAGSRDGMLYALETVRRDSRDWTFAANDDIASSSPVIDANGVIYFGSRDNHLYAIDPGDLSPADSPWPMFRGNSARTGLAGNITISDIISTQPGTNSTENPRDLSEIRINFSPEITSALIDIESFQLERITKNGSEIIEGVAFLRDTKYSDGFIWTAIFERQEKETELPYDATYSASISYLKPPGESGEEIEPETFSFTFTTETETEPDPNPDPSADFGCFIGILK